MTIKVVFSKLIEKYSTFFYGRNLNINIKNSCEYIYIYIYIYIYGDSALSAYRFIIFFDLSKRIQ